MYIMKCQQGFTTYDWPSIR